MRRQDWLPAAEQKHERSVTLPLNKIAMVKSSYGLVYSRGGSQTWNRISPVQYSTAWVKCRNQGMIACAGSRRPLGSHAQRREAVQQPKPANPRELSTDCLQSDTGQWASWRCSLLRGLDLSAASALQRAAAAQNLPHEAVQRRDQTSFGCMRLGSGEVPGKPHDPCIVNSAFW